MQGRHFLWPAMPVIFVLSMISAAAHADSAGILSDFQFTSSGAFSAEFREDRDNISIIEFSGDYNRNKPDGQTFNVEPRAVVAQEFFRTHPDQYDFLITFTTFEFDTGEARAFHVPLQNKVEGIGIPVFDSSHQFGSQGKLLGFTDMAAMSRWVSEPMDPEFEVVMSVMSHEIFHQWGPKVRFRDAGGNLRDALLGRDGAHWSYLLDSDASVEYGSDWRDNGDGTFTSVGIRTFYSPLDLYLMGMYGPDEVPPFTLVDNPTIDKTKLPEQGVTIEGTANTITIQDIIAAEGPRVPDATESQKEFRMAFLLLTAPGERVDDRQVLALNNIRNAFMTRFSVLTGGRAIAHINPEALPVHQVGEAVTVSGGAKRNGEADLDAALLWLRQQQNPEGYWNDKPATRGRDTSVVADVLEQYDTAFDGLVRARGWLRQQDPGNTDYLARTLIVESSSSADVSTLQQRLAALRNSDGGWGIADGYASDSLDTALALSALSTSASVAEIDTIVNYLRQSQNDDGGWSGSAGGPSRTSVTAQVILALKKAGKSTLPAMDRAIAWIAGKQNSDGGFGDSPSTAHDTALVLLALLEQNALERILSDAAGQYLLRQQTVDGSWAGSTYATALAVAALKQFAFTNWAVESVSALPNQPRDGERVTVTTLVRNTSALGTPQGVLRLYSGDPDAGGVAVGTDITIPPMAAGTTFSFTQGWDSLDHPGSQALFTVVDPDSLVVEVGEADNRGSVTVDVQPAPNAVDLEVVRSDITIMPQHPNRLPSTLGININLRNLGLIDASSVRVLLWEGMAGSGTLVGESTLDVLGRSTVVANFTYSLEKAGVTRLTVQLDPDNVIPEINEDNNIAWAEVVLDPSVDLGVDNGDITLDRTTVLMGQDVTFSVTLHNYGTQPSPPTTVRYLISNGTSSTEIRSNTVEIAPGEILLHSVPWRADFTGIATFTVQIDSDGLVAELDENNNVAIFSFPVGNVDGPNLVVGHQDFLFTPNPALEGSAVVLDAIVRNSGNQPASNVVVAFFNGDPANGGTLLGTQVVPSLAVGAQQPVSFTWEAIPNSGENVIYVVVDPDNTIVEFSEEDNRAFNLLPVLSLPDLAIADGDLQVEPAHPRIGDSVVVTARLANIGQQPASAFQVHVLDGAPDAGGLVIGEQTISSLPAGEGTTVSFSLAFSGEQVEQPIVVQLDPAGSVPERFTGNNIARRVLTVQNGDLSVSNRYFSPNGDGVKDDTTLSFRLQSPADAMLQIVNEQGNRIRNFSGEALAAATTGIIVWDGRDDHGHLVGDGDYRARLTTIDGTILGEQPITLDTNRSSLLKAIESGQARETNLTCHIDLPYSDAESFVHFSQDGDIGFYKARDGHLVRWIVAEERPVDVVSLAWFYDNSFVIPSGRNSLAPTPDGKGVFFILQQNNGLWLGSYQLWYVEAEGGTPLRLGDIGDTPPNELLVSPDGRSVSVKKDNSVDQFGFGSPGFRLSYGVKVTVDQSPNGAYLAIAALDNSTSSLSDYERAALSLFSHIYPPLPPGVNATCVQPLSNSNICLIYLDPLSGTWYTAPVDTSSGIASWSIDIIDTFSGTKLDSLNPSVADSTYTGALGLSWSPDGKKLAVSGPAGIQVLGLDGGAIDYQVDTSRYANQAQIPNPVWDFSGSELFLPELNLLLDVHSKQITPVALTDSGSVSWEPGQRALLSVSDVWSGAYFLEENRQAAPLLGRATASWKEFTNRGGLLYRGYTYRSNSNELLPSSANPTCINKSYVNALDLQNHTDTFLVESYSNLLANLDPARNTAGGISLHGTASDLHFSDYLLEYVSSETPGDWRPVGPASSREVIDGELAFWVPPGRGTYQVRLTVNDLAGNTRSATHQVVWSDPVSISNLYRNPDLFSPNGDGIMDTVTIHYRVLEPVHLQFTIENSAGDVVRSINRDHSLAGTEHDILWDGRDDLGILLPDGDYTLRVQNYQFRITIDNTLPNVVVSSRDAYQSEVPEPNHPEKQFVVVNPGLSWEVQDTHLDTLTMERGVGELADWQPFALPQLSNTPQGEADITLEDLAGARFRLTAQDTAGNRFSASTAPISEQLMITGFGEVALNQVLGSAGLDAKTVEACTQGLPVAAPENWLIPVPRARWMPIDAESPTAVTASVSMDSPLRISLAESVATQLVQLDIEYREHGVSGWQQLPVEEYLLGMDYCAFLLEQQDFLRLSPAAPDHRMEIHWAAKTLLAGKNYDLRIRGFDALGKMHLSNAILFTVESSGSGAELMDWVRNVDQTSSDYMERVSPLISRLTPSWDRDAEELLWAQHNLTETVGEARLILRSNEDARYATPRVVDRVTSPGNTFLFRVPDLRACNSYSATLEVYGEINANGEAPLLPSSQVTKTIRMPCFELAADTHYVSAETCGAPSPNQIMVQLHPQSLDGGALKLLTLSRWDSVIGEDIVYNVNQPVSGRSYEYPLDTTLLPDGPLEFTASLVSVEDKVVTKTLQLQIDHTPPQVDITYPVEGQRVCGIPQLGTDGVLRNVLAIEGTVVENASWHYQLEANDSLIHDSRNLDSLEAAAGNGARNALLPDLHLTGNVSGPVAALTDGFGEIRSRIRVYDSGGFQQCAERNFYFDGVAAVGMPSVDLDVISPNGDGESDQLTILHRVDEAATVNVGIYAAVRQTNGNYSPNGPVLRTLQQGVQLLPGESAAVWDGHTDNGAVVPDGDYIAVITYEDGCGNRAERSVTIAVDGTAPEIVLDSPQAGETLPMVVELFGSVDDLRLNTYIVQFGTGSAPATWSTIATGSTPIRNDLLARWNTYGLIGDYTLRIVARDVSGNTSELVRTFRVPERVALVSQVEVSPGLFSPNGDGRLEQSVIRVGILESVIFDASVFSADGVALRSLAKNQQVEPGEFTLSWDGRDNQGELVVDGNYSVLITATLQANSVITQQESLSVTVDRSAPLIEILQPASGYINSSGGVVGTVSDSHLVNYVVQLTSTPDVPVWNVVSSGFTNRTNDLLASLAGLEDGNYAIRVIATDEAANRVEQALPFVIDNTPPEAELMAPLSDTTIGAETTSINVQAQVNDSNLSNYRIMLGEGEPPQAWLEVARGEALPVSNPLATLDTASMPDGVYSLRLVAEDKAGNQTERQVTFQIDKTLPTVEIHSPTNGEIIIGPSVVTGSVIDSNLDEYRLYLAAGTKESAISWNLLSQGSNVVNNDALHDWQVMPANGIYTLRLEASDTAGNTAQAMVEINVSAEPPAPPEGLFATVENSTDVRLNWIVNTEQGIQGYNIYRDDVKQNAAPVAAAEYLDSGLADGTYHYTATAIGIGGVESDKSQWIEIFVDTIPPTTGFTNIRDGGTLGGVMEVLGSAYAPADFKEYRLSAGVGNAPASWELLRQSPIPISTALLGVWDTTGLEEGAVYTLKLEAEDLTGNVGSSLVAVTIDNAAPAAPTGLVALESGADVVLTWNANDESDVAGYVIFRNGEPINAATRITTAGTSYTDTGLADGRYDYSIVAVDRVGNASAPSQLANVLVDTRAPHALIISPDNGAAFDRSLYVLARSEDSDIASVEFQYRAMGASEWNIISTDTSAPYEMIFDTTVVMALPYGEYELQAVATDMSGKVDPAPAAITVTYQDLTRPAVVVDVSAIVHAGDVTLSWSNNSETDLAGYYIYASINGEAYSRITAEPITQNNHVLTGLSDATYSYYVTAIDTSGNEGDSSAVITAVVYTPQLSQPYTPTVNSVVALSGTSDIIGTVVGEVVTVGGVSSLNSVNTDNNGNFTIADIPLVLGTNTFTVQIEDGAGNTSKSTTVKVLKGEAPSRPSGLVADVTGYDVALSWNANPEPDLIGYRVYRDGVSVQTDTAVTGLTATASHNRDQAARIFSGWSWGSDSSVPMDGQWISVSWLDQKLVTSLTLNWLTHATAYDIEGWNGEVWVPLLQITDNVDDVNTIDLTAPYLTNQLRIVIRSGTDATVTLTDMGVSSMETVPQPLFAETLTDGLYEYTVTAVNIHGFESVQSDPASASVGDVTPPSGVELNGIVNGSSVTLSWMPSSASDVTQYEIYRNGELIAQHIDLASLTATDAMLPNGTYTYTVHAMDGAGNRSASSNPFVADVTVELLPPPTDIAISSVEEGEALMLFWVAAEPAPNGYIVYQANESGGPYTQIYTGTEPFVTVTDLVNGESYFFVIVSVDSTGNSSVYSTETVGIPADTKPPSVPVITNPTMAGITYETSESLVKVAGTTDPGAYVYLARDGVDVAGATALSVARPAGTITLSTNNNPLVSSDGRFVAYTDSTGVYLREFDSGEVTTVASGSGGKVMQWTSEGLIFVLSNKLQLYRISTGQVEELLSRNVTAGAVSPDGKKIIYHSGYYAYLYDRESAQETLVMTSYATFGDSLRWSPDNQHVAFRISQSCYLVNTTTNSISMLASSGGLENPVWSRNGEYVVYTEQVGVRKQLQRYWVQEAREESLVSDSAHDIAQPVISPDGSSLMYVVDQQSIGRMDLATGETFPVTEGVSSPTLMQWLDAGYLTFYAQGSSQRLALPGRFEFSNVELHNGDNSFDARAEDVSGNVSLPSSSILVRSSSTNILPDLLIAPEDISVLPEAVIVGDTARINMVVRNSGMGPAENALLSLVVRRDDGLTIRLLDNHMLPSLSAGGMQSLMVEWTPPSAGNYSLIATIDPADLIGESNEQNNVAIRPVVVTEDRGPRVVLNTDKAAYGANEQVILSANVTSYQAEFSGSVELLITDAQGYSVAEDDRSTLSGVPAGQSIALSGGWNTGNTFAGSYLALARLLDPTGVVLATAETPFTVMPASVVDAVVTSDSASYGANANVRISGTINYRDGNTVLQNTGAHLVITSEMGDVVAEARSTWGDLMPQSSSSLQLEWNTGPASPGNYIATLVALEGDRQFATGQSVFTIEPDVSNLSGALGLSAHTADIGDPLLVTYQISNNGNMDIDSLPIAVTLIDPASQAVIQSTTANLSVPLSTMVEGAMMVGTQSLQLQNYRILLHADITEGDTTSSRLLATADFNVVDRTPPVVEILTPGEGDYLNGEALFVVNAQDTHSRVAKVEISQDGSDWLTLQVRDASAGLYQLVSTTLLDGVHTVTARATDTANNVSISASRSFTIDNTAPQVDITGVTDGAYYATEVTPIIEITDANLAQSSLTIDDAPFVSGTAIGEGRHTLDVHAEDLAGNITHKRLTFTVDTVSPQILIDGVEQNGLYNRDVTPLVTVTEDNPDTITISLNGEVFEPGTVISIDGIYQLVVSATDLAGNVATHSIIFEIDKTPPSLEITAPADGLTTSESFVSVEGSTEPNAMVQLAIEEYSASVSADAAGNFSFINVPLSIGRKEITAISRDRAGNESAAAVFYLNVIPPVELHGEIRTTQSVLVWAPVRHSGDNVENSASALIELMAKSLSNLKHDYHVVSSEPEFVSALRTQRYGSVVIVEPNNRNSDCGPRGGNQSCGNSHFVISEATDYELRLMVASGMGLLWIKPNPDSNEHWEDLFGTRLLGVLPHVASVQFEDGERLAGTYGLDGDALNARVMSGVGIGSLLPTDSSPAIVVNRYGKGDAVLMTFDPSDIVDSVIGEEVLLLGIESAASSQDRLLPGGYAEVLWHITQATQPMEVVLEEQLPDDARFVLVGDGNILEPQLAAWSRLTGVSDSDVIGALIQLPDRVGTYSISAVLSQPEQGSLRELLREELPFQTSTDLSSLALDVIAQINSQPDGRNTRKYNEVLEDLTAVAALGTTSKVAIEVAIEYLLNAEEALISLEERNYSIEESVGLLLRGYQIRWSEM